MLGEPCGAQALADGSGGEPDAIRIAPDPAGVRRALAQLRAQWQDLPLDVELCERAELILAEVLNNVVEHAHGGRGEGTIEVRFGPAPGGIFFLVTDDGVAMPGDSLPDGTLPDLDAPVADLPEGGFGWFLIRSMVQDLQYRRTDGCNRLSFWMAASR